MLPVVEKCGVEGRDRRQQPSKAVWGQRGARNWGVSIISFSANGTTAWQGGEIDSCDTNERVRADVLVLVAY